MGIRPGYEGGGGGGSTTVTGGLDQAAVDRRIHALVDDRAEASSTERWPKARVPADTAYSADITGLATAAALATEAGNRSQGDTRLQTNIDDVAAKRSAGDDLQSITVNNIGSLNAALSAQETSDQPLFILFTAKVTRQTVIYEDRDLVRLSPRSTSPERIGNFASSDDVNKRLNFLVQASPGHIDKNNIPEVFNFILVNQPNAFPTATKMRVEFLGVPIVLETYNPASPLQSFAKTIGDSERTTIAGYTTGSVQSATVRLLDAGDVEVVEFTVELAVTEGATSGGGKDQTARDAAEENRARIDAIPVYTALLSVWPPNVRQHTDVQRDFQSTLARLDPGLATNAGSTGTRFTNTFRIFARNANGDVVQLHTQGWSFTADNRQSIPWEVDATEFNRLGTESATTGLEVWGEFRAIYGGGVNEFRGRTNPVFIDFGEEPSWPATRGDLSAITGGQTTPPPFADIRLLPEALPGSQVPDNIDLELAGKQTSREIDGITLEILGQPVQPHSSTPVSGFDTEAQALVRFDVSGIADRIANNISATDRTLTVDVIFSFTEGSDVTRRILLPVNNQNAPRLVQGELDSITFNAALTLDWLAPDMRTITLTDDITFAFSNIQVGRPLIVEVIQGAPGGHGITWPSSVEWAGGSAEGPTAAGNAVDIYTLLPLSKTRVLAAALLNVS